MASRILRGFLFVLSLLHLAAAASVALYQTPVSSSEAPAPLAQISYDPSDLTTASIVSYTPPKDSSPPSTHILISLPSNGASILTSASTFTPSYKKKFLLHVDEKGEVYHIGLSTSARAQRSETEDEVEVEVVRRGAGPRPVLNKPVVLNREGRVEGKEVEKTFLQKYWWALLLFVAVQFLVGGGDEK